MLSKCTLNFNFISSSFLFSSFTDSMPPIYRLPPFIVISFGVGDSAMEYFICAINRRVETSQRRTFWHRKRISMERGMVKDRDNRKFDSVRGFQEVPVLLFRRLRSLSLLPILRLPDFYTRSSILWLFCHHRAYNSHFMSLF